MNPTEVESLNDEPNGLLRMPAWLLDLLATPPTPIREATQDDDRIRLGQRNDTIYRLARSLRAHGLSSPAIRAAVKAENNHRCDPPLPDGEVQELIEHALTQPNRQDFIRGDQQEGVIVTPSLTGGNYAAEEAALSALRHGFHVTRISDVEPEEVKWLWPGYIPAGKLTLLAGDPGTGKSYVSHDVIARLTSAKCWPDGTPLTTTGSVILLQAEDGVADTIRPRLDALGADTSQVYQVNAARRQNGPRLFSLEDDLSELAPALNAGVRLLVIDPITAYLGKADSHKDADVRRVLTPVAQLADQTGVAVLAIMHLNKKSDLKAVYRIGGSIGFVALARMVLHVAKDSEDEARRLLMPTKHNIPGAGEPLEFRMNDEGRLGWMPAGDVDVEALVATQSSKRAAPAPGKLDAAKVFLRAELQDGSVPVAEVKARAGAAGLSSRTLERAKQELGIMTHPRVGGGWLWVLPAKTEPANPIGGELAAEPATAKPSANPSHVDGGPYMADSVTPPPSSAQGA